MGDAVDDTATRRKGLRGNLTKGREDLILG